MDRETTAAKDAAALPHDRVTRRAATLTLLTLDTAAWCGGFLGAAWTRPEFELTAAGCVRALGMALAPEEVRGLDPFADPDEVIRRLAALCDSSRSSLSVLPGQR